MKRTQLSLIIAVGVVVGVLFGLNAFKLFNEQNKVVPITNEEYTTETIREIVELPKRLEIASIGVDAFIEEVGLDSEDRMDVPKLAANTAWYNLGTRPGELGNSVIDGHLDKITGEPAVFYRLSQVKVGDEIITTDESASTYKFIVSGVEIYQYDQVPLVDIFGPTTKNRLILITCRGSFDETTNNYSQRVVVYSELE